MLVDDLKIFRKRHQLCFGDFFGTFLLNFSIILHVTVGMVFPQSEVFSVLHVVVSNRFSFKWFQTDLTTALEECIISILVGIARHSPAGAIAIMKCQRLVETVIRRFTMKDNIQIHPSKIISVTLLKVSDFITFFWESYFIVFLSRL